MSNIDSIMNMLNWNQPEEVQAKGRELAKNIKCINVFIRPINEWLDNNNHMGYSKEVWDNCALILCEKSDLELMPHIRGLFEWLEDLNWPGALCIWDRLLSFNDREWLVFWLKRFIEEASTNPHSCWYSSLLKFQEDFKNQ
ncbi:MAG: DUF5071 domain-containing protein [Clostridia bacterium]|nr:DUF5071 domain-containing protein [Clostridia bacterium]